jgi:acyl-CoA dehydrogenase
MRAADEATERAVHVDDFDKDILKQTEPRAAAE